MTSYFKAKPVTIYVDMDGVLAAWTETVMEMYGVKMPDGHIPYEVYPLLGKTGDEVWEHLNTLGPQWWADLPAYSWCNELWTKLSAIGADMAISTAPCRLGNSAMGKTQWLLKHIAPHGNLKDVMIGGAKWRLADPRAVLVDDCEAKVDAFNSYGGVGVLFPRQWNRGGFVKPDQIVDQVVSNVRTELLKRGVWA